MENTFGLNVAPFSEEQRIKNLKKYKIVRTKSEPIFDELAAAAATLFDVPIAMINFVDTEQVRLKPGSQTENIEHPAGGTNLCSLAVLNDQVPVFANAIKEPCLVSNPLIAGYLGMRFYAAAPILTSEGFNIGTVCIVDNTTRKFGELEKQQLASIAGLVNSELEKRNLYVC